VLLHDSVCATTRVVQNHRRGRVEHGHSKWYEGEMSFYYMDTGHPITASCSNFELDDEMYYDLHMMPEAHILAPPSRRTSQAAGEGRRPAVGL